MHVIRTDGNLLQYNDVADQFVVVGLGIVAVMVHVKQYRQSMGKTFPSVLIACRMIVIMNKGKGQNVTSYDKLSTNVTRFLYSHRVRQNGTKLTRSHNS